MSESHDYRGYHFNIVQDTDPESPREWDNLGTMTCFHRKYTLGDKHNLKSGNYEGWGDLSDKLVRDGAVIILPLFLFDHSGLRMSTTSEFFRAVDQQKWDWGQVGFIHISRQKIFTEFGYKKLTKERRDQVTKCLSGEVDTYDQYLSGEVYGYQIEDDQGNNVDSCFGFYGHEDAVTAAKDAVDGLGALSPA